MTGTDPDSEPDKLVSQVLDQAHQTVVPPGTASNRKFQPPQLDVDFVVNDDHRDRRRKTKVTTDRTDGTTALVHVGPRLHQQDPAPASVETGDVRFESPLFGPFAAVLAREGIHQLEPDVVPRSLVFAARVSQADNDDRRFHTCTARETDPLDCSKNNGT